MLSNKKVLKFLFRFVFIRHKVLNRLVKLEGGQIYSETLRKYYLENFNISVGMYTYGGIFNKDNIASGTKIGRYCSIAPTIYIYDKNHPYDRISQHPFFYNPALGVVNELNIESSKLIIGNDVWIGQNAIITPSVSYIGNGAVIAAGAVVTKNVPDYAIVAGSPAKILKYRFNESERNYINESKWWEKSIEEIKIRELKYFTNSYKRENE